MSNSTVLDLPRMPELLAGALLHDIGKLVQRAEGQRVPHSDLGAEFLSSGDFGLPDMQAVLDCVRYHHRDSLQKAHLPPDGIHI